MDRYPALKLFLIFMLGILVASAFSIPFIIISVLIAGALFLALAGYSARGMISSAFLLAAVLLAGMFSYQSRHLPGSPQLINGSEQQLLVRVISEPRPAGKSWRFVSRLLAVRFQGQWQGVEMKAMTYVSDAGPKPEYGDLLSVGGVWQEAMAKRNPGGFDYRSYLEHQEVSGILRVHGFAMLYHSPGNILMSGVIIPLRRFIREVIERHLGGDQGSLLAGLLLGERYNLSRNVIEAFSDTGTSHVLAVSGLHAGLMAFIIFVALRIMQLPKRLASIGTMLGLTIYALAAGASPSIVRSSIMVVAVLLGGLYEKRGNGLNMLGLAGLLILSFWPDAVFDIGFQLSFAATAGILIITRPVEAILFRISGNHGVRKWILTPLAVSLAAQIFTGPLMAWHFHRIPMISLLANLAVVPLTGLILALGLTLTLTGILGNWISWPVAASAFALSSLLLKAVHFFSGLKVGTMIWPAVTAPQMLLYAGSLTLPFLWRKQGKVRLAVIALVMFSLSTLVWQKALAANPGLRITFLDVGQADCALIEFPNGRKILIDAGLSSPGRDSGRDVIVPFLRSKGIGQIDCVVISHSDADHCGGLSYLMDHQKIKSIVASDHPSSQQIFMQSLEKARDVKSDVKLVSGYDTLCGIWPARGFFYSREDSIANGNESSLIFYLCYGNINILFPGDMGPELKEILGRKGLLRQCKILKVPHHGARPNNPASLASTLRPELAVISVGENNRFGHPSREALDNYSLCGTKIFRTDQCGAVIMETEGENIKYSSMLE